METEQHTIDYLKEVLPGQSEAWYQRVAAEIAAEKQPPPTVSPRQHRILNALTQSETATQGHYPSTGQWQPEPTKPIETSPQLEPIPAPQPAINPARQTQVPDTVTAAVSQWQNRPTANPKPKPITDQHVRTATSQRLYRLTKDWAVAFRLADKVQLHHPDKSAQWCWEKAIYDLERDRHA